MSTARDLLSHPDPRVAALYRGLAGQHPRAVAARTPTPPSRAGRAAKRASIVAAGSSGAGIGKARSPGTSSRFAHFAGLTLPTDSAGNAARPIAPATAGLQRPMTRAEMLRDVAANGGRVRGFSTAEDAAALVLRSAKAAAPAQPRTRSSADMNTPEGVAAFVLSAGRRPGIVK